LNLFNDIDHNIFKNKNGIVLHDLPRGKCSLEKFVIKGGKPLLGEVTISGAKNAAVAILPATILADGPCILENVPSISDVSITLQIMSDMGAKIRNINKTTIEIDTTHLMQVPIAYDLARKMRASSYFLGTLLGRFKKACVPMPGGCNLGDRPLDQHIKAFDALGADCKIEHGMIEVHAEKLTASHIYFDKVTVGATINAMFAAVKAEGLTIIENAAKEPHIVDVANFLNSMGADIMGAGTDVIKVRGVEKLYGANYAIIPDQIEAGTFMVAAAATRGNVLIKNVIPKHLDPITLKLEKIGAKVVINDDSIRVIGSDCYEKTSVKTMPHPGFPTDMQPQMTTLLTLANGTSIVTESIFDNRFRYVDELRRMGADILVDGKVAVVQGVEYLTGAPVKATDLRAGAAVMIAGLIARGTTEIEDIYHIERGYENMVEKLRSIGADITKKIYSDVSVQEAL